nr:hypothetical protein [Desulfobulbaceae bacterium]
MRYLNCAVMVALMLVLLAAPENLKAADQDEAIVNYHKGIAAQTIGEREKYFEKALELYLAQYNSMKQDGAVNGLLCYNIGNCYFNLEQNEEAIFYYQLGKKLLPIDSRIKGNLAQALAKRQNAVDVESSALLDGLLFFHYKLSAAEQIKILIGSALLTALCLTWLILRTNIVAKYASIISGFVVFCLFASLAVEYYQPNHVGILMKATDVRRGAGSGFAPITSQPLGGGSSLQVIHLTDGWYSVKLNDGRQGFIEQENLKLITM